MDKLWQNYDMMYMFRAQLQKQTEHVPFVSTLSKGRNLFDIVAETVNIVAKNGNNVEATNIRLCRKDEILR